MSQVAIIGQAEPIDGEQVAVQASIDELRLGVAQGQLRPYVQAVMDLQGATRIMGAQSLLRWQHPRLGVLDAGQFLHLVQEAGLMAEVDLAALRRLAADVWRLDPMGHLGQVWLNISGNALSADALLETLAAAGARVGLGGGRLGVRIPAAALRFDQVALKRRLATVRALGVAVAVDRFGTDPALSREPGDFPVDVVKLDRSLTARLDRASGAEAVSTAINQAHDLGATVIAQGVERAEQVDVLRRLKCDGAQGYLFGPPVPIEYLVGLSSPEPSPSMWWG